MTRYTDDRRLYWEQRRLDEAQEEARTKMINRNEPTGHNRDYWLRPLQGDRQHPDYGHNRLGRGAQPENPNRGTLRGYVLLGLLMFWATLLVAVLSTPRP